MNSSCFYLCMYCTCTCIGKNIRSVVRLPIADGGAVRPDLSSGSRGSAFTVYSPAVGQLLNRDVIDLRYKVV